MKHLKIMLISAVFSTSAFASTHLAINGEEEDAPATTRAVLAVRDSNVNYPHNPKKSELGQALRMRYLKQNFLTTHYETWGELERDAQELREGGEHSLVEEKYTQLLEASILQGTTGEIEAWQRSMSTLSVVAAVDNLTESDNSGVSLSYLRSILIKVLGQKLTPEEHREAYRVYNLVGDKIAYLEELEEIEEAFGGGPEALETKEALLEKANTPSSRLSHKGRLALAKTMNRMGYSASQYFLMLRVVVDDPDSKPDEKELAQTLLQGYKYLM